MESSKKRLHKAYLKHIKRVAREDDIIDRARDRKYYHRDKAKILSKKLELIEDGQLEFNKLEKSGG